MLLPNSISGKKAALDALRPLSAPSLAALNAWYDVELTYSSNALEGNTLTRSETAIVLEKGITVSGKPLKDHLEAQGHQDALLYMRQLAKSAEPVRETDVRNLHRLVLQKIDPDEAGRYSTRQRLISGSPLLLPSPAEIPSRMGDLAASIADGALTPEAAFDAHEALVTIHPFSDGNGRTARLLMNLLLLRAGYPPVVILPEDRPAYHQCLAAVQLSGNRAEYHAFLYLQLEQSLDRHLMILRKGLERA